MTKEFSSDLYHIMKNQITLLIIGLFLSNSILAKEKPGPVQVKSDELVIQVDGIVCSFCANGMENNLSKLKFIDKSRFGDGILININTHRTTLALTKDKQPDLPSIYQAIAKGGYDLKKVYFHLEGTLKQADGNYTLKDQYTGKSYILQAVPENAAVGKAVTIKAHLDAKSLAMLKPEQTISIIVDELK